MTWRQQMVCRILLMVAVMLSESDEVAKELRYLSNTITQHREFEEPDEY